MMSNSIYIDWAELNEIQHSKVNSFSNFGQHFMSHQNVSYQSQTKKAYPMEQHVLTENHLPFLLFAS